MWLLIGSRFSLNLEHVLLVTCIILIRQQLVFVTFCFLITLVLAEGKPCSLSWVILGQVLLLFWLLNIWRFWERECCTIYIAIFISCICCWRFYLLHRLLWWWNFLRCISFSQILGHFRWRRLVQSLILLSERVLGFRKINLSRYDGWFFGLDFASESWWVSPGFRRLDVLHLQLRLGRWIRCFMGWWLETLILLFVRVLCAFNERLMHIFVIYF